MQTDENASPETCSAPGSALFPEAVAQPRFGLEIRTIDDIRPHIRPQDGIYFFPHGDFTICRYTSSLPTTFQTDYDLECRCLIFDRHTGVLLSRTFHKFFNLGERQTLADLDLSQGFLLENKLDGSMIGAFVWKDQVVYHTRGGISDQALAAARAADAGHDALVREAFDLGFTPNFELTGPDNRVVIPYLRQKMTLLALRHRLTGEYNLALRNTLAAKHAVDIPQNLAEGLTTKQHLEDALARLQTRQDIEGAVIVLANGHRLKAKTLDYMRRHKILGNIDKEKYVYLCYLEDLLDDTAAALGGERGRALTQFVQDIDSRIDHVCAEIVTQSPSLMEMPPKKRAQEIKSTWSGILQAAAFVAASGQNPKERILEIMLRQVRSEDKRDAIKADLGLPSWNIDIQSLR